MNPEESYTRDAGFALLDALIALVLCALLATAAGGLFARVLKSSSESWKECLNLVSVRNTQSMQDAGAQ